MSRPPESETPLVKRLREVAGGADTEFGEDSRLMYEAATALSLAQTEIKGHMRVEDDLRRDLASEVAIVNRVWKALGIETYDAAKPLAIDEHVTLLKGRIAELEKDRDSWKREAEMIGNAWQRELCDQGILYRHKTHWIDFMVLATRQVMALAKENGVVCCNQPELCAKTDCNKLLRYRLAALKSRA